MGRVHILLKRWMGYRSYLLNHSAWGSDGEGGVRWTGVCGFCNEKVDADANAYCKTRTSENARYHGNHIGNLLEPESLEVLATIKNASMRMGSRGYPFTIKELNKSLHPYLSDLIDLGLVERVDLHLEPIKKSSQSLYYILSREGNKFFGEILGHAQRRIVSLISSSS